MKAGNTILVTGGAGFVGSNLISRLLEDGHKVICLDNFSTGRKINIQPLLKNPNFRLLEADVGRPIINLPADQIYHLASPASPLAYQKNPVKTLKTNFLGTLNMLELAKKITRFYFWPQHRKFTETLQCILKQKATGEMSIRLEFAAAMTKASGWLKLCAWIFTGCIKPK